VIADLEKQIQHILTDEAARVGMNVKTDVISTSPAAVIPGHRESYLVRMAEAVHRVMGFDPPITNAGSNSLDARLGEVAAIKSSHSRAAAECVCELFFERQKQIAVVGCGQVRDVHFDPCPFEQWQGIAPFVSRSLSSALRPPFQTQRHGVGVRS